MNFDVGYISKPQLDLIGSSVSDMICHWHRIGRLFSPSSAANRRTSTKFDNAVSVKLLVRIKPTRIGRIALPIRSVSGAFRVRTGTQYPTILWKGKLATRCGAASNRYTSHVASLHAAKVARRIVVGAQYAKINKTDRAGARPGLEYGASAMKPGSRDISVEG